MFGAILPYGTEREGGTSAQDVAGMMTYQLKVTQTGHRNPAY